MYYYIALYKTNHISLCIIPYTKIIKIFIYRSILQPSCFSLTYPSSKKIRHSCFSTSKIFDDDIEIKKYCHEIKKYVNEALKSQISLEKARKC